MIAKVTDRTDGISACLRYGISGSALTRMRPGWMTTMLPASSAPVIWGRFALSSAA